MKKILSLIVCLFVSTLLSAGVKEKKGIRKITHQSQAGIETMKAACGNAEIALEVDIDAKFTAENMRIAIYSIKDFFTGMKAVCDDADYKEEIVKVTKMVVTLSGSEKKIAKIYGEIKLVENVIHVAYPVKYSMSNGLTSSIPNAIKALY